MHAVEGPSYCSSYLRILDGYTRNLEKRADQIDVEQRATGNRVFGNKDTVAAQAAALPLP